MTTTAGWILGREGQDREGQGFLAVLLLYLLIVYFTEL